MRVNQLAKITGVDPHTIRYYSRLGLLVPTRNPRNQYREYVESDIQRLRFIRQAKLFGFSLREIEFILLDADEGVAPSEEVRNILKRRTVDLRAFLERCLVIQERVETITRGWEQKSGEARDPESLCELVAVIAGAGEPSTADHPIARLIKNRDSEFL